MLLKGTFTGLLLVIFVSVIHTQDYTLRFAAAGLAKTVDSVQVVNLTRGNTLTIHGSQSLHLNASLPANSGSASGQIRFYPNPMYDNSRMEFETPDVGLAHIALYDVSGRKMAEISRQLLAGLHTFRITGTLSGVYLVKVNASGYSSVGKLISTNYGDEEAKIVYESSVETAVSSPGLKQAESHTDMSWQEGDLMQFTFISGNRRITMVDVPAESKIMTATFYPGDDIDNNHYDLVVIGTQVWMADNLKTTRLNDGTAIPLVTGNSQWSGMNSPAYCWRSNDESTYKDPYGALYNWHTVNSGKLCPVGWHVPVESDWSRLELYLGGRSIAGGKLKEGGYLHWNSPNTGATDNYYFAMIGGGYRDGQWGPFYDLGRGGYLWSAGEQDPTNGKWRGFSKDYARMDLGYSKKSTGMSVRCLMDENPPEPSPGTVRDYEGNVYKTVVIGKQTWMAENLRNTHLANGERIPELKTASEWVSATTPGFSWRNNNETAYKVPYGALYNAYALVATSLCPSGYHFPLTKDYLALLQYAGSWSVIGGKLKEEGTSHWAYPNTGATNVYGFTMLPGGYRSGEGSAGFYELGRSGYLWMFPLYDFDPGGPWYWQFSMDKAGVDLGTSSMNTGFSARCMKDDDEMLFTEAYTDLVENVTSHTADARGSCNGITVFARGFCWSTDPVPDTTDLHTAIWYNNSDQGLGFRETLKDLKPATTYHIRAYGIQTNGISYGQEKIFTTLPDLPITETVTDIDGNVYKTVKIGNEVWMAENLKTTRYADGTPLLKGTRLSGANGKYYYVYAEDSTYKDTYGLLYSWFGATNSDNSLHYIKGGQGVCPSGWHIPDKGDKDELMEFLGGSAVAAGKLKESGFEHWISPNTAATNESGFTGRGAGIYTHLADMLDGYGFLDKNRFTAYWTSEIFMGYEFSYPAMFGLNYRENNIYSPIDIYCGASVRCLKDRPLTLQKDLVAWYPLSGNPFNTDDFSGKEHGGTVYGSTLTMDRFGRENQAYHFDGSSYIEVRDHSDLDFNPATSFSIACWLRLADKEGNSMIVLEKGIQNFIAYRISVGSGSDPGVIFTISRDREEAALYKPVSVPINDDAWHFVVAIVNREEKSMKLYQDGDLLSELTVDAARDFDLSSDASFKMGKGDLGYFFKGDLDDVRVYRRALQEAEIKELYHENGF